MTKSEYRRYQQSVADFMKWEGIDNLSPGHIKCPECNAEWGDDDKCPNGHGNREGWDEPFFSWYPCVCCQTRFGGDREHATGYNPTTKEIQEYTICIDCAYYAAYGRLDDTTMMDIDKSPDEWMIVHPSSGETVEDGFKSEEEAYDWLRKACDRKEVEPANINEYAVERVEFDD